MDCTPLSTFIFFFEIMQVLMEEINRYYHQYLDMLGKEHTPFPDLTIKKIYLLVQIVDN
jgi:hypothetical protein